MTYAIDRLSRLIPNEHETSRARAGPRRRARQLHVETMKSHFLSAPSAERRAGRSANGRGVGVGRGAWGAGGEGRRRKDPPDLFRHYAGEREPN